MTDKKPRRVISFAEKIADLTRRIDAAQRRVETLKLVRQAFIEGEKLKAEAKLKAIDEATR